MFPKTRKRGPFFLGNAPIELKISESLMPRFYANFQPRQRYRLILITEKSSLRPILQPIAEHVGAELLAMTGESSHTRIAEFAARADADGRAAVVLYFSDHDPSRVADAHQRLAQASGAARSAAPRSGHSGASRRPHSRASQRARASHDAAEGD